MRFASRRMLVSRRAIGYPAGHRDRLVVVMDHAAHEVHVGRDEADRPWASESAVTFLDGSPGAPGRIALTVGVACASVVVAAGSSL